MKFILFTRPDFFAGEEDIINTLFENGLELLHLRKPNFAPVYMERLLSLINPKYYKKIVIHDFFYLREEFGLLGIHLNSRNPVRPEGYSGHISMSCHSIDEVEQKKKDFNYVFLSPIFDSISKPRYKSGFTLEELKEASDRNIIDRKVIALGGIDSDNIKQIKKMGFGGVAVIGDVWDKFDYLNDSDFDAVIRQMNKIKSLL